MKEWTKRILIGVTAGLVVYDVAVAVNAERGDTISELMAAAPDWIKFACGFLCGHFFWPQKKR